MRKINLKQKVYKCGNTHVSQNYYQMKNKENPEAYPAYWLNPVFCECGKGFRPISV